ncbi:MAG TPA: hypothetical protein VD788_11960 [Candidatus Polarisedimenticolaceae bacterium]|nr:hypothetical protein [Candidatus Polarisedimenticolaceae bacterium]
MILSKGRVLLVCAIACVGNGAGLAQPAKVPLTGILTDSNQRPVADFRVILRVAGTSRILVSPPTDDEGSYRLDVDTGINCAPIAVVSPLGKRVALAEMTPVPVLPGTRFDIELEHPIRPARVEWAFRGADRLFVSFVEDAAFVGRQRAQAQLTVADFDRSQSYVSEFLAAYNWRAVPTLEVGGRIGYAGTDFDRGGGASGMTDLEFWGKFLAGSSVKTGTRWAPGAVLTLPTGDADTGLSAEASRLKLFATARHELGRLTLSGNLGLRYNEDATIDGTELAGEIAGSLGIAALLPVGDQLVGVAELYFEGKRFEQGQDTGLFLVGANWKPLEHGFFRLAAGFGLEDGAPDFQLVAGYVFDF